MLKKNPYAFRTQNKETLWLHRPDTYLTDKVKIKIKMH